MFTLKCRLSCSGLVKPMRARACFSYHYYFDSHYVYYYSHYYYHY